LSARRASPIASTRNADEPVFAALRRSELIGRLLGEDAFLDGIRRSATNRRLSLKPNSTDRNRLKGRNQSPVTQRVQFKKMFEKCPE
jgi:hypothetical protein